MTETFPTGTNGGFVSLLADRKLAEHIIVHHMAELSSWEVAFCRPLAFGRGELGEAQTSALDGLWRRIQNRGRLA
jgi:hypothetical protein